MPVNSICSSAVFGQNPRYCYSLGVVVVRRRCRRRRHCRAKTLTFFYMSVITADIYLKLRTCVHYTKNHPYYQGRQFKMQFFFSELYLFLLGETLTFCNISVITEDIFSKLGRCVHYTKSNP